MIKILAIFSLFAVAATGAQAANVTTILTQPACTLNAFNACTNLNPGVPFATVRTMTFHSVSAGTASVSFDGSLQCQNGQTVAGDNGVVDLVGQIMVDNVTVPNRNGLSANEYAMRIPANAISLAEATNLHATRIISYTANETVTVRYKFASLRMDANTGCFVRSAAFSVIKTSN
jgi:hypothetical protein